MSYKRRRCSSRSSELSWYHNNQRLEIYRNV